MGASRQLACATGIAAVDRYLSLAVAALETTYPGMIRSYYLIGSHAAGTATDLSNIDLFLARHRGWLLDQLRLGDVQGRRVALSQLSRFLYPEPDVGRVVRSVATHDDSEVRRL